MHFSGYCSLLSGARETHTTTTATPAPCRPSLTISCWCQSSWSLEPSRAEPRPAPFICLSPLSLPHFPLPPQPPPPWPLLIIIEFLEIFTVKGKGNSPPDFCIRRQRTGCLMLAELPPHHPVPSPCLLFRRLTLCSIA